MLRTTNYKQGELFMEAIEQIKDWWVQGFQLNPCYLDDWDEIKSHFSRYGLKLNQHGPIMTMSELKFVREAARMAEVYSDTPEYKKLYPNLSIRERKGRSFILHLSVLPYFSRTVSLPLYEKWIEDPDEHLVKISKMNGTMKSRDKNIEETIRKAIVFLRKKE